MPLCAFEPVTSSLFHVDPARSSHNSSFETAVKRLNAARHKRQVAADVRWYSLARAINRREISHFISIRVPTYGEHAHVCECICMLARRDRERSTCAPQSDTYIRASTLAVVHRQHFSRWKLRGGSHSRNQPPSALTIRRFVSG